MAATPKFANEIAAQNHASFRIGTLEHFAQEWEPAFAPAVGSLCAHEIGILP
jgi:hypothetical protein